MSSPQICHVDLEQGSHQRSMSGSDMSMCSSDAENGSCYSRFYSTNGDHYDDYTFACVSDAEGGGAADSRKASSFTDCSVELEIESGVPEIMLHLAKVERDCRICHLGLDSENQDSGGPIELGCSCKDDLGAAHKKCAEAWFKIKGNRTCEICHSVAQNIGGANEETTQSLSDSNNGTAAFTVSRAAPPRRFWHSHRFLNFLLACIVFAFVISWLFHFNMASS